MLQRNTIKALNWFSSIRTKLDDPLYSGWFYKFSGKGNYSQPDCDTNWSPKKCSGFWHDQAQSPGTLHPGAGYPKADGTCAKPCFCGVNPCGEYIFDHRNASFSEWFLNEWMISNETLLHPGISGLLLDDHMLNGGPSETHGHFTADTGLSTQEMAESVKAYNGNMVTLWEKIVEKGGFAWDLFGGGGAFHGVGMKESTCRASLENNICSAKNNQDARATFYKMNNPCRDLTKPCPLLENCASDLISVEALLNYSCISKGLHMVPH